jgi:hypothetical protein
MKPPIGGNYSAHLSCCFIALCMILLSVLDTKAQPKIELYLLNKRLPSSAMYFFENKKGKDSIEIRAGKFVAAKEDLEDEPFLSDSDFLAFDTAQHTLLFSEHASRKLGELKPEVGEGIQFSISIDKRPVLSGYIWSPVSSMIPFDAYFIISWAVQPARKLYFVGHNPVAYKWKHPSFIHPFRITGRLK